MSNQNELFAGTPGTPGELGKRLFEEDRFPEAIEELTRAIQIDPTNTELLKLRADAFFLNADFEQAFDDLDRLVDTAPNDASSYLARVEIRSLFYEMEDTLDDLNRALELDSQNSEIHVAFAAYWNARFDLGKLEAAANRAVSLDPKNYSALCYQGTLMYWRARFEEGLLRYDRACEILEKRLENEYRSFDLLISYAALTSSRLEEKQALALLDEGVLRFPKIPYFYTLRGNHHIRWGDHEAAEKDFDKAKIIIDRFGMKISEYQLARSDLYARKGDTPESLKHLRSLLEWMPRNINALQNESILLHDLIVTEKESSENALMIFDRFCELLPEYSFAFILRGWLLQRLGKEHESNADFEHALENLPNNSEDYCTISYYLIESGLYTISRDLLCEVLDKEPDHVYALGLRGIVWNGLGIYDRAVEDLNLALEKGGPDASLFRELGMAWIELGTNSFINRPYRCAIDVLSRGIEFAPKDADLWKLRGTAWHRIALKVWFGGKKYLQNALEDYSEAIRLNPNDHEPRYYRALVHWKLSDYKSAIEDCTEAINRKPDYTDAMQLRETINRELKPAEQDA